MKKNEIYPTVPMTREPVKFIYKPIMQAWIGRKKGGAISFYSFELRTTLSQIANRGTLPQIDFDYGFQSLVHLIEEKFKGQYNEARIYGLHKATDTYSQLLMKFKNGKVVFDDSPNFGSDEWIKFKENRANRILHQVRQADEVYEITNLKRNLKKPE
jgi:hypothetical protein